MYFNAFKCSWWEVRNVEIYQSLQTTRLVVAHFHLSMALDVMAYFIQYITFLLCVIMRLWILS